MGQRWTEDDIKKLRPGMVVEEKNVKLQGVLPSAEMVNPADNHSMLGTGAQEKCKTTISSSTVQALGRMRDGEMNKTEARFAQLLKLQQHAGEILWWEFEPMNLRLGINCYYRIDFMVMKADGQLIAYEVKGKWEDDALVKIRTAAEKFPWPFIAVRWVNKEWEYRHF